jgi:uncharacterized membrane protein
MDSDLLRVFFAAMLPLGELRLSIPLGVWVLQEPWLLVFLVSFVGNMAPVVPLLLGLERFSRLLDRLPGPVGRIWDWRTERIRTSYSAKIERYGPFALAIFVGIPLPMTGAWSGALAAWLFQVPFRLALPAIALGVLMAGAIVTAVVMAGLQVGFILAE